MSLQQVNNLIQYLCTHLNVELDQVSIIHMEVNSVPIVGIEVSVEYRMTLNINNDIYCIWHRDILNEKIGAEYGEGPWYCYDNMTNERISLDVKIP